MVFQIPTQPRRLVESVAGATDPTSIGLPCLKSHRGDIKRISASEYHRSNFHPHRCEPDRTSYNTGTGPVIILGHEDQL